MKKIKTFQQACKKLGIKSALPDVSALPKDQQKAIIAHYKLVIIAKALNDGWKPNWKDSSQWKYYPWFDMQSGSGLSYYDDVYAYSISPVGSRLAYKSSDLARYAGKQFIKLYKDYFLIGK
jgi:hypothetical protein